MMDLRGLARALGGDVSGRSVLAPAPGHSPKDRSMWVTPSPGSPDGFLVHLFSGAGDRRDDLAAKSYVLDRLGIRRAGPADPIDEDRRREERERAARRNETDKAARRRRATDLWHEARDPRGTIVERYLGGRAIRLGEDVAGAVIRFHPACPFRDGETLVKRPAMLAAMRDIRTDELGAVHRTALSADAQKIERKMLGPAGGCAIKLDGNDVVTAALTLGEGIETTLSGRDLGFRPAWAMGTVGGIAGFPLLGGIETLTLLEEADDSGASPAAVRACGGRWHAAGREVVVVRPRRGSDLNDAVRGVDA